MNNTPQERNIAARLLIDSFYEEFEFLQADREKLIKAFAHMFLPARFLIAEIDGITAGMLAVSDKRIRACHFSENQIAAVLGTKTARAAALDMEEEINMLLSIPDNIGFIEYVATDSDSRGKGVASAMLKYAIETKEYKNYILEVFFDNSAAIRLYQKHGFVITDRQPLIPDKRKILMERKG